jgi:hypothetical protein
VVRGSGRPWNGISGRRGGEKNSGENRLPV